MKRSTGMLAAVVLLASPAAALAATDYAPQVQVVVKSGFQKQISRNVAAQLPGARATVTSVQCIQINGSAEYKCLTYYTVSYKRTTDRFEVIINADQSGAQVLWQAARGTQVR